MDFVSVKISTFGSTIASVIGALYDTACTNTDVITNRYGETVNEVGLIYVQFFDDSSYIKEQLLQKFPYLVHPAIEAAFAQHGGHQSGATDKANSFFHISPEVLGGNQHGSSNRANASQGKRIKIYQCQNFRENKLIVSGNCSYLAAKNDESPHKLFYGTDRPSCRQDQRPFNGRHYLYHHSGGYLRSRNMERYRELR
jgi:hypothetical protein